MFKTKDFMLMDVVDIRGKKIGFINDIIIDFKKGDVKGFVVSSYSFFQKTLCVLKEDIVSFNKSMIVSRVLKDKLFTFSKIKGMDIINCSGNILGMAEDILFHEFTFKIQGLVVSTGFIKNLLVGKKILLVNSFIIGEQSILYYSAKSKVEFISVPHKLFAEENQNEKTI
ncbi:PRC-barrel domain-containing protein [Clostridium swellfunianum]|uniref:PRC-barrel domain-containing protein n=1 Tax=Clostridium swellfunianum TaxID=1367462 RepID=UPI00202F22E1|nr:PRC-barrel domain-containing protein [Clostridium swellfunianum]MCM0648772.1 PRC-barrel domain-containing protein [Clostridium swellfunianum]